MKKIVLPLIAAAAVAFPAAAGAGSFSGIVVAKQVRRHALVVASHTGVVRVVHTHHLATRVGARVTVTARRLGDGTFTLQDDHPGAQPGDEVDETVTIDNGNLDEDQVDEVGHTQKLELEGSIVSVTAPTTTADGEIVLQVGTSTIHVVVPAGTQLPSLAPGQNVELKVTLSGTTFTLVKADEEDDNQGDDNQGDDDGGGDD